MLSHILHRTTDISHSGNRPQAHNTTHMNDDGEE